MFVKYKGNYLDGYPLSDEIGKFVGVGYDCSSNRAWIFLQDVDEICLVMNEDQYSELVEVLEDCILRKVKLLKIEGECFIFNNDEEEGPDNVPRIYKYFLDNCPYF